MQKEQLNDELTIIGLILVLLFATYYLVGYIHKSERLHSKVLEAQRVAIYLNNELAKAEIELTETKDELTTIKNTQKDKDKLDEILKDIATSFNNGRKN